MCTTCGCSDSSGITITDTAPRKYGAGHASDRHSSVARSRARPSTENSQRHAVQVYRPLDTRATLDPEDAAQRGEGPRIHAAVHGSMVSVEVELLAKNQSLAERNRDWFAERGILALNLVSSPGSGKTSILERTIRDLHHELPIEVIEGDQATLNDALRIRATGCKAVQINTGAGCHLDAEMLAKGVAMLGPRDGAVLMIENVGNLVCPALFDLGEMAKVVILSVTEGEDKPVKYPHMFRASRVMLLNKTDLLPYLRFDVALCIEYARQVNPDIEVFEVSATSGAGMEGWYTWLRQQRLAPRLGGRESVPAPAPA